MLFLRKSSALGPREQTRGVLVQQQSADFEGLLLVAEPALHFRPHYLCDGAPGHLRVGVTQLRVLVVTAEPDDLVHRHGLEELLQGPARDLRRNYIGPTEVGVYVRE